MSKFSGEKNEYEGLLTRKQHRMAPFHKKTNKSSVKPKVKLMSLLADHLTLWVD